MFRGGGGGLCFGRRGGFGEEGVLRERGREEVVFRGWGTVGSVFRGGGGVWGRDGVLRRRGGGWVGVFGGGVSEGEGGV